MVKQNDKAEKSKKAPRRALGRGLSALISSSAVPVNPQKGQKLQQSNGSEKPSANKQKANTAQARPKMPGHISPEPAKITTSKEAQKEDRASSEEVSGNNALALNPESAGDGATERPEVDYLPIKDLTSNPGQPRQVFDEGELDQLADSIKTLGVLQPVLVRPRKGLSGQYEIVAGERRWRAATKAELSYIPVIIRDMSDREALELGIVENVQRADLSPLEEARAYKRLIEEFSLSQKEVAAKVGKDRASIANYIRLLKLPHDVLDLLRTEKISIGHAKAILTVKEPGAQLSLARKVVKEGLSVRALEAIVSRVVVLDRNRKKKKGTELSSKTDFPEALELLRRALGTKVAIKHKRSGKGKIEIDYFSEAELDRIVSKICD